MTIIDASYLRKQITKAEDNLESLKRQLDACEHNCNHQWSDPVYDPIITKGYQIEGDPVGTMGIDRRLPHYVSGTETPQWTRICNLCGKTETTKKTQETIKKNPVF